MVYPLPRAASVTVNTCLVGGHNKYISNTVNYRKIARHYISYLLTSPWLTMTGFPHQQAEMPHSSRHPISHKHAAALIITAASFRSVSCGPCSSLCQSWLCCKKLYHTNPFTQTYIRFFVVVMCTNAAQWLS